MASGESWGGFWGDFSAFFIKFNWVIKEFTYAWSLSISLFSNSIFYKLYFAYFRKTSDYVSSYFVAGFTFLYWIFLFDYCWLDFDNDSLCFVNSYLTLLSWSFRDTSLFFISSDDFDISSLCWWTVKQIWSKEFKRVWIYPYSLKLKLSFLFQELSLNKLTIVFNWVVNALAKDYSTCKREKKLTNKLSG